MTAVISKGCPRFTSSLSPGEGTCATLTKGENSNEIILSDACGPQQYCYIPAPQSITLTESDDNMSFTCLNNDAPLNKYRYPGERCTKNEDCINVGDGTGSCDKEACTGAKADEKCIDHSSCIKGLYCDKKNKKEKKCVGQKDEGSRCDFSVECKNKYLCYNGTCRLTPFTLKSGTPINKADPFAMYMCESEFIDPSNGQCSKYLQEKISDGRSVECKAGEDCVYTYEVSGNELKLPCECGYNSSRKGYCRKGHNNISK
jgi:hypothetical protein